VSIPGFIRRNWKLKVGCCVIAFFTWVGVVYAGNPPETKVLSLAVPQSTASIPPSYVLVHAVDPVQVRVGGDQNTLDALNTAALTVNVDWSAANRAGMYSIPISIVNSDPSIELINPPTSMQVDLDSYASKSIPVTIQITNPTPVGFESGTPQATPSTVMVRGPAHELVGLEALVTANLSTQKANFQAPLPVLVYSNKVRLNNVELSASYVSISIAIKAVITTKVVAVLTRTEGNPSPGHYLTGILVSPITVIATGSQDLLNTLDSVSTAPIPLNGIFGLYTVSVTISAPAGVTLSQSKATVTIEMGTVPAPPPTPTPTPSPTTSP
jgi:YbbR domain-containing protein